MKEEELRLFATKQDGRNLKAIIQGIVIYLNLIFPSTSFVSRAFGLVSIIDAKIVC